MMPSDFARRRDALRRLGAVAVAGWLPARLAVAAAADPGAADGQRLVVVMLRGALDGLAAVPAIGDPAWPALRARHDAASAQPASPPISPLPLDTMFALHPSLPTLHRWYHDREMLVLHATATPYRERSHFDAQQLLESGGDRPYALATGWLGRALQSRRAPAVALLPAMPLALRGADDAGTWTPARPAAADDDYLGRVAAMYRDDPALAAAWSRAVAQQGLVAHGDGGAMAAAATGAVSGGFVDLARRAGEFVSSPAGPRVAWLETTGWDTHAQQQPRLQRLLGGLDDGLAALRQSIGASWQQTTVLVVTEFGRTAAYNGSGGTDHGTGGIALLAGGNVAGGRVIADWPGLAPASLLDGRDLRPTTDLRGVIAAVVQQQFRLPAAQLAQVVPGATPTRATLWRGSAAATLVG